MAFRECHVGANPDWEQLSDAVHWLDRRPLGGDQFITKNEDSVLGQCSRTGASARPCPRTTGGRRMVEVPITHNAVHDLMRPVPAGKHNELIAGSRSMNRQPGRNDHAW